MINKIMVYISDTYDVYKNLAIEKYLFDIVKKDEIILYLWQNKDSVIIGRNQNPYSEFDTDFAKENSITVARRLSGGGTVFHDTGNLNFSFVLSKDSYDKEKIQLVLIEAFKMAGINACISGRNDILTNDKKFSGNAFFSLDEKICHHGTVMISSDISKMTQLLKVSREKLKLKGIKSVKSRVTNLSDINADLTCEMIKTYLIKSFENIYNLKSETICDIDFETIDKIRDDFKAESFIYPKTFPYTHLKEGMFSLGKIEFAFEIKENHIHNIMSYSDVIDETLPKKIMEALNLVKYSYDDIYKKISEFSDEKTAKEITQIILR